MPLLQTSGNVTADGYGGGVAAIPNYIEDVFQTWLYAGNGSTQTITNGIDLAGKGGLVWIKSRSSVNPSTLFDTARGATKYLFTTSTAAQGTAANTLTSFNTTGFSLGTDATIGTVNTSGDTYASWTFRKQPKFFDIVTYTGNGTTQAISHNLGSAPGCIIVKRTDASSAVGWFVYHQSLGATERIFLNLTDASANNAAAAVWGNNTTTVSPTSTNFTIGNNSNVNTSGGTYVAYLFAHNAGGFGLTGTDNVISCGSFTTDSSGNATVDLGYEPQWILTKRTDSSTLGQWYINDNMRGMPVQASAAGTAYLTAESSAAEAVGGVAYPTSTGFKVGGVYGNQTNIYIAIRRGPMKVPTSGTSVFSAITNNNSTGTKNTTNFPVDLQINTLRDGDDKYTVDRLRGVSTNSTEQAYSLSTNSTNQENTTNLRSLFWDNTGFQTFSYYGGSTFFTPVYWNFRRAPGFFDEVCWSGSGSYPATISHNLGVAPELIITKRTSSPSNWIVYNSGFASTDAIFLNTTGAVQTFGGALWGTMTSTTFGVGSTSGLYATGVNYVAYLFATCAGVSKVGSYTGNGTTQTINCGFTGGARFVLIKRTDSTGDWYVYDTARGMTTLTDPYLRLNSTAAESATLGSVTTVSTGFAVNASILAAINTNAASYIFLAIS